MTPHPYIECCSLAYLPATEVPHRRLHHISVAAQEAQCQAGRVEGQLSGLREELD